ncbi:ABC transporter ATP-binding protein [Geosporobacter ferrireducens]|uniref:ABC transporter domain-containing protein n=1 Tax=Geosporobacter ferrireducens TaxID=1424294 RepID=A0A1D8GHQ7_9FIRM|nr:ABC transporter ATP-binding protein [Geosporobacter ferrireducens]AOT70416.1 hypothetical protein Gferi_12990 [Geosporobacter ferrireducens]MTI58143.1 ABC transporter ATP-binding protein [Geosporobacter ferrireducens]
MDQNQLLQIKDLRISFPYSKEKLQVVRGVDLTVKQGEIIGILGESGSGKTVSSTAVLRLFQEVEGVVDSGEILYKGRDLLHLSEKEINQIRGKEIAYIFQDPTASLNPYRRIGKQLMEAGKTHGHKLTKEIIQKQMADVGLDQPKLIYNMYPFQLSGGQCQRIVIAMALLTQPELIIADEPTNAIDASLRKKILSLLKKINTDHGTAMMIITHDFDVVKFLCSRVVVLYGGLIMEEGSIEEVLEKPMHPYTRELLHCVNSLQDGESTLYCLEGKPPSPYEFEDLCPFYDRCKEREASCREGIPLMVELERRRKSRCIHCERKVI